ncbi:hypothetical protein [Streptomyces galilaeus]|uniref:hypothetical protein n=1 Tax=Streptomyces galilaeus TaxID=33899 RepID=UPI0019A7A482|nr:hypothetical protein [Streptomyces galilaeus]GGW76470.1 hypothetical protein GCM10010350_71700 [Streptomyces galilaeus]
MTYAEMAEAAARRDVCLIPEEWAGRREYDRRRKPSSRGLDPPPKLLPLFALRAGLAGSILTGRKVLP